MDNKSPIPYTIFVIVVAVVIAHYYPQIKSAHQPREQQVLETKIESIENEHLVTTLIAVESSFLQECARRFVGIGFSTQT